MASLVVQVSGGSSETTESCLPRGSLFERVAFGKSCLMRGLFFERTSFWKSRMADASSRIQRDLSYFSSSKLLWWHLELSNLAPKWSWTKWSCFDQKLFVSLLSLHFGMFPNGGGCEKNNLIRNGWVTFSFTLRLIPRVTLIDWTLSNGLSQMASL